MFDEFACDENGRFQMPTEELNDFIQFLKDNEVACEVEQTFRIRGASFSLAKIREPFDIDTARELYGTWRNRERDEAPAAGKPA